MTEHHKAMFYFLCGHSTTMATFLLIDILNFTDAKMSIENSLRILIVFLSVISISNIIYLFRSFK